MTPERPRLDLTRGASDTGAMTVHAGRPTFSFDPVIAEAKRRMRQRRLLVAALIVALAGIGAGATFALRGPGGSSPTPAGAGHGSAVANIGGLSLSYPVAWRRVDWNCWNVLGSYLLLTTARPTPRCGSTLPPPEELGRDGVAVWFASAAPLRTNSIVWHINPAPLGVWAGTRRVTCAKGAGTPRRIGAHLQHGSYAVAVGAVVCGPHQGHSEDVLQRVLGNSFFTR